MDEQKRIASGAAALAVDDPREVIAALLAAGRRVIGPQARGGAIVLAPTRAPRPSRAG